MSSFSDEPNLIPEGKRSKRRYLWGGAILLFIGLLLSVAFFPKFIEFRRSRTPIGPHHGSFYRISFEKKKFGMEIARSVEFDYRFAFYIVPLNEEVDWEPQEYELRMRMENMDDFETLPWDPVEEYFGLSEHQIHPAVDVRLEMELIRGDKVVWSGKRWSFRVSAGHSH